MSKQYNQNNQLHIATIGKAVGLKGDMKFYDKSDFPEQFVKGASFSIGKNETITLSEVDHDRGLIKIVGCTTPEDAKKFTNKKLYTSYEKTKETCHLEEGQYFWFDIEGCRIFEDDKYLGIVDEVERIGVVNYLSIVTDDSLVKKGFAKSFLLPYQEPFILSTDIDEKIIKTSGAMDILEAS